LRGRIGLSQGGRGEPVPHRAVILDDVFTTGATLDACARVLLDAGCAEVRGLTLVIEE
jgi:predicted amidophosphoribosyltransferase